MPYCRRCGTQLWENARFCHKCGTQAATFIPAPSTKPASRGRLSTPEIALIAVAAVAAIVVASIFVLAIFYPVAVNHASSSNQTTFNAFSSKIPEETPTYVLAMDLRGKASLSAVSAVSWQLGNLAPLLPQ